MKFCGKCGNPLDNTKKFCTKCGAANPDFATLQPAGNTENELKQLQIQKELIERQLEQKAQAEMQKRQLEIEIERQKQEALEKERQDKLRREQAMAAAEAKKRELEAVQKQQQELKEKEQAIEAQSEILQKIKLERELLQRELDQITDLRLKRQQELNAEAPAPRVQAVEAPVKSNKTGKRVGMAFIVILLSAALAAGGYFAYQKFWIQDPMPMAVSAINAQRWSEAAVLLKKAEADNNAMKLKTPLSSTGLEQVELWRTGAEKIATAVQYPGVLLSGTNPSVKNYKNVLAKFEQIPFEKMKLNVLADVDAASVFEPVYLLHDSVELELMQQLLKDQAKLSIQKESLIYSDGSLVINFDSLEAGMLDKQAPATLNRYHLLLEQKTHAVTEIASAQVSKPRVEPAHAYVAKPKPAIVKPAPAPAEQDAPKRSAD